MKVGKEMIAALVLLTAHVCGCGGAGSSAGTPAPDPQSQPTAPLFFTANAQNGAVIVTLRPSTPGATVYYTTDGSVPTTASQIYQAPFSRRIQSDRQRHLRGKRRHAQQSGSPDLLAQHSVRDACVVRRIHERYRAGTQRPNPNSGPTTPATAASAIMSSRTTVRGVRTQRPAPRQTPALLSAPTATCTSRRSSLRRASTPRPVSRRKGSSAFNTGGSNFAHWSPKRKGSGPLAWLLGNNIVTVDWPACGEQDVLERVNAAKTPDWNEGSIPWRRLHGRHGAGHCLQFPDGPDCGAMAHLRHDLDEGQRGLLR